MRGRGLDESRERRGHLGDMLPSLDEGEAVPVEAT
jgi:hypothetical protein